ncbi:hypothetical protein MPNT_210046 [Candidatus Methylacidithermus pantelleriae]|uniref:Uncharacterized protein n=1 Tax=Candidatus Methylacidithermus pantelleriae TaxID=2744239 RepID=A0A8J2FPU0_9BACT|nr:hypothetical protein MPNT_210046 [Candidatus Methylacidithermus pantelleriae]
MTYRSKGSLLALAAIMSVGTWTLLSPIAWAEHRSPQSECCSSKATHCVHKNRRCYHEGSKRACYHKKGYCYHGSSSACCHR